MSEKGSYQNYQEQPPPHHHHHQPPPHYGTFQGFPQPAPPPETGYMIAEGIPVREQRRLPCCGIGYGWFLFIIGFFLGAIPWYLAAFIMLLSRVDPQEKPGYVACTVAAILATIAIIFGATHR